MQWLYAASETTKNATSWIVIGSLVLGIITLLVLRNKWGPRGK